jgi:RNA-splicing ligase RtcB
VPAAVGVDIGCGMMAVETSLTARQLPDSLAGLRVAIEAAVPHGRTGGGRVDRDQGAWHEVPAEVTETWTTRLHRRATLAEGLKAIIEKHPKIGQGTALEHLGTLSTGNHFIEVCLDEGDRVWVMLHSGSRGIGNRIGIYFIERAKREAERWFIPLPDPDLAYLPEGTELFWDYVQAVGWAQAFARANRELMMGRVLDVLRRSFTDFAVGAMAVNCHLRRRRAALRRQGVGHPQGRGARRRGRTRHHPRLDGRQVVHRPRQGQPGIVPLLFARRRPGDRGSSAGRSDPPAARGPLAGRLLISGAGERGRELRYARAAGDAAALHGSAAG